MNGNTEALEAARRHVKDSIDSLDELENQSTSTLLAVALLTGARVCIDARLTMSENGA